MKKRFQLHVQWHHKNALIIFLILCSFLGTKNFAQNYNLGIGNYPGDPKENFAPTIKTDSINYQNIALLKPVYGSGSYNFCLSPQLITDGIKETEMPGWTITTVNDVILPRNEREYFIDRHPGTGKQFEKGSFKIQMEFAGNPILPEITGFKLSGEVIINSSLPENLPWQIIISGSNDGDQWNTIDTLTDNKLLGKTFDNPDYPRNFRSFEEIVDFKKNLGYKIYRAEFNAENIKGWRISEFAFLKDGEYANIGGPYNFSSSWKSMNPQNEWIYIDLGTICSFDKMNIYWLRRAESGSIQISNDAKTWETISSLPSNNQMTDEIIFEKNIQARYVRLMLDKAVSEKDGFILSEIEVFGKGSQYAVAHVQAEPDNNGNVRLSGGAWKLQRTSFIKDNLETISQNGYEDKSWITATVPGTVLVSYLNNGMIPDPNYADNQFQISDSYFYSDFIYRDEFSVPPSYNGKKVFLNFDGINWKADVFLNGNYIGKIEGAFIRSKFDVTEKIIPGKQNAIAVYIYKNNSPGYVKEPTMKNHDVNGGQLGLDNPTFHASVGWDWIPSIHGRNIGIWNDVYLSTSGSVTIEDPFISSKLPLPDTTSANLKIELTLRNHANKNSSGILKGQIGDVKFETPVLLSQLEMKTIILDPSTIASLQIKNPKLWWPNGYGEQNLYDVKLEFVSSEGNVSDVKEFKTGIREMSYTEDGGALKIWVNGKRFIGRGGNWGFSESNLRYRAREYNIAVRYHKEMNFTMIRNWVGQTGDDEFFEACDKYGIMIWQDFWLANPCDGPDPANEKMFVQNAEDFVKRIRNHPSIGLYCGRNEGNPPEELDKSIRKMLAESTPDIKYISHSAENGVSGYGDYNAMPVKYYFQMKATQKLHSEMGMPNVVSLESFNKMIPDSCTWPINKMWGVHDFNMESAQSGETFIGLMEESFGEIDNLKDWLMYAQWINYQGYRAMFEAQSKNRMGLLIWMSHSAWPSFVWQTYDYFFEPTAAYFGCKKANESLHIQWNAFTDSIEVVNYSNSDGKNLNASVEFINLDGSIKLKKQFAVECTIDQVQRIDELKPPEGLSNTYFVRLKLEKENIPISENFYWSGLYEGGVKEITTIPKTKLDVVTKTEKKNGKCFLSSELSNNSETPALMVKIKVVGDKNHERILPVIFSDNFVSLMPGEKKTIAIEVNDSDTNGEQPSVVLEGVNLE